MSRWPGTRSPCDASPIDVGIDPSWLVWDHAFGKQFGHSDLLLEIGLDHAIAELGTGVQRVEYENQHGDIGQDHRQRRRLRFHHLNEAARGLAGFLADPWAHFRVAMAFFIASAKPARISLVIV